MPLFTNVLIVFKIEYDFIDQNQYTIFTLLFGWELYLMATLSPISSITSRALSSISLVWDAETQNLTLPVVREVAGNAAPTVPMPFLIAKRTTALNQIESNQINQFYIQLF